MIISGFVDGIMPCIMSPRLTWRRFRLPRPNSRSSILSEIRLLCGSMMLDTPKTPDAINFWPSLLGTGGKATGEAGSMESEDDDNSLEVDDMIEFLVK